MTTKTRQPRNHVALALTQAEKRLSWYDARIESFAKLSAEMEGVRASRQATAEEVETLRKLLAGRNGTSKTPSGATVASDVRAAS